MDNKLHTQISKLDAQLDEKLHDGVDWTYIGDIYDKLFFKLYVELLIELHGEIKEI